MRPASGGGKGSASSAAAVAVAIVIGVVALGYGFVTNATNVGEVSSMSSSVSSQGSEISSLSASLRSMSASLDSQSAQISSMNASLNSQSQKVSALQSTVGSLQANITALQAKLTAVSGLLNSTKAADSAALQRLTAEVLSLNSTLQALINEVSPPIPAGPGLVQKGEATCSYVCNQQFANATFPLWAHKGDMLVVTLVADDVAGLTLSDSLGTNLSLAVRAISSSCSTSNSGACQAEVYWGIMPASGPEAVTVREIDLGVALRVQIWEFSGVTGIGNTASCSPTCSSVAYPSSSILIATARDVNGSGPGFTWYPYAASGVAGSEYRVAMSSGSTAFPFSVSVNDAEVAAVLV